MHYLVYMKVNPFNYITYADIAAGTNLPVGGAVSTQFWLGGSVLGVASCPESEFRCDGGTAVIKMISSYDPHPWIWCVIEILLWL